MQSLPQAERGRFLGWAPIVALAVVALGLTALFQVLAQRIGTDSGMTTLDRQIADAVVAGRTPGLDYLFWGLTLLGNALFLGTVGATIVILLFVWGCWERAFLIAGGMIGAQIISSLVKYGYQRPRPPETAMLIATPVSHSFPSGHAFLTLVVSVLALFLLKRYMGRRRGRAGGLLLDRRWVRVALAAVACVAAVGVVLGVGFSRVYLGVHWTSDVLAGWSLGGAWSAAVLAGFMWWKRSRDRSRGSWSDACPQARRKLRIILAVVMIVVALASYVVAGLADPLLT